MRLLRDSRSIVGIDPTSRGLAFVFFENGRLLDWGTRSGRDELAVLDRIIDHCAADVVVLEDPDAPRSERRPRMRDLLRTITQRVRDRGLSAVLVPRIVVRRAWAMRGITRKHAVAASIANDLPELAPFVPRPRKIFQSEASQSELFDAASLVLYAFASNETNENAA